MKLLETFQAAQFFIQIEAAAMVVAFGSLQHMCRNVEGGCAHTVRKGEEKEPTEVTVILDLIKTTWQ